MIIGIGALKIAWLLSKRPYFCIKEMDQDNVYSEKKLPKMTTDKILHNAMHAVANYYTVTVQVDETNFNHETKKIYLDSLKI